MQAGAPHWNDVYSTKAGTEVSWYQAVPKASLELIASATDIRTASIIDIGGGVSRLVFELLARGCADLTVLDISEVALSRVQASLAGRAGEVNWIVADVTSWTPSRTWDVWHDRAAFHFLTEDADQEAYIAALKVATHSGSAAVISCFDLDGPERCSGLPVQRYSAETLAARLGSEFELMSDRRERHTTPAGRAQSFTFALLRRR